MKKIYLYTSLIAAALTFSACNEDFTDWANPQTNAQEEQQGAVNGTIAAAAPNIDLNQVEGATPIVNFISAANATEGSKVVFTKLLLNGDIEVPFSTSGDLLMVNATDLSEAIKKSTGSLAHTIRECNFKVFADLMNAEGTSVLMPIETNEVAINVTTFKLPAIANESAYYYIGGYNSWNLSAPTPMEANGDGTYSCVIEIGDSEWFAFAPQSAVDNQDWNALFRAQANGDEATSGFFGESASGFSFCCPTGGKYKFTIDPQNWTYSYAPFVDKLYYAGDAYGWPADGCAMVKNGDEFVGYYYVNTPSYGSFKFVSEGNWYGGHDGKIEGDDNISPDHEGYYKIAVNWDAKTYTLTEVTSITCVGNHNGWNVSDASQHLTYNADEKCWELTTVLTNGFKFAMNDDWSISWGGANGDPKSYDLLTEFSGKDLDAPEGDGTYSIKLYLGCEGTHKVVLTKK